MRAALKPGGGKAPDIITRPNHEVRVVFVADHGKLNDSTIGNWQDGCLASLGLPRRELDVVHHLALCVTKWFWSSPRVHHAVGPVARSYVTGPSETGHFWESCPVPHMPPVAAVSTLDHAAPRPAPPGTNDYPGARVAWS
jgi:hypothetical protein